MNAGTIGSTAIRRHGEVALSRQDREKWNARYAEGAYSDRTHPSPLLEEWLPRLVILSGPPRAVDIACGNGRNALFLARNGWKVDAIDISEVALKNVAASAEREGLAVNCIPADLESGQPLPPTVLPPETYDLAVVFRYANLALLARLKTSLKTGGYLIVEAHMQTDAEVIGPKSARFRLAPGALRQAAADFDIVDCREGLVEDPDGRIAALAQLVARVHR